MSHAYCLILPLIISISSSIISSSIISISIISIIIIIISSSSSISISIISIIIISSSISSSSSIISISIISILISSSSISSSSSSSSMYGSWVQELRRGQLLRAARHRLGSIRLDRRATREETDKITFVIICCRFDSIRFDWGLFGI